MHMLAHTPVKFNYLETLANTFNIPARLTQFFQENTFSNAPIRRCAVARNTNSAFTGLNTKNPSWYEQFDVRQIKTLTGGQPIVDFGAADNFHLYFTTMKAMKFLDNIPSIPMHSFKNNYAVVLQLTSMRDATEISHYPKLDGELLKLESCTLIFLWKTSLNSVFWENECLRSQFTSLVLLKKTSEMVNVSTQRITSRIPLLKYRYSGFFPLTEFQLLTMKLLPL